ncbi:MAG: hypothetical protein NVSMB26_12060 [Beijerinckiaceae bacterium]
MPKITKRIVDGLRPDKHGKDIFVWDAGVGALKGFGVPGKPSGWHFLGYRPAESP